MAYKYNQLLKLNLQKDTEPDLSPIEAEISDLQQKKVTKFFSATDTLEDGEVAEYQGTDDAVNGLVNGYFYKKGILEVLSPPVQSIKPNKRIPDYNIEIKYYYYYNPKILYNFNHQRAFLQYAVSNNGIVCIYPYKIGDTVYNLTDNTTTKVTQIVYNQEFPDMYDAVYDNEGRNLLLEHTGVQAEINGYYIAANVQNFYWANTAATSSPNGQYRVDWLFIKENEDGSLFITPFIATFSTHDETINITGFIRVDTQPRTPGVTVVDGVLQISLPVEFSGNITVHGSEVVVTTEQIQSENDFIKLRYNNPLALAAGETSGISVNNYDGNNTDCILAVDKDGWARVGDSSGTLEKIATIEETPTDAQFVQYDTQNKQLKTAAIPEATTTIAGLMSASDKIKLNKYNIIYEGVLQHNITGCFSNGHSFLHIICQSFTQMNYGIDCYIATSGNVGSNDLKKNYFFIKYDSNIMNINSNNVGTIDLVNNSNVPDDEFLMVIEKFI